jgi:2,4-dienoyl-CoA reductase-like NADH-dependent reductase (Old Yellow Enzyme family)
MAPSPIPFADTYAVPKEMDKAAIEELKQAFVAAVRRAKEVGVDFIEIHGAHGYLLHSGCLLS